MRNFTKVRHIKVVAIVVILGVLGSIQLYNFFIGSSQLEGESQKEASVSQGIMDMLLDLVKDEIKDQLTIAILFGIFLAGGLLLLGYFSY